MEAAPADASEHPDEEAGDAKHLHVELPALATADSPHAWNDLNEKQLRSALIGACKRMPRNAEAHFHLGLMYMRKCDGEEALRSFQHCKQIYAERLEQHTAAGAEPPPQLLTAVARLRSHTAQAAHMAAAASLAREERAPLLERLQKDLVAATNLDNSQPDVWNALALLHLTEGGYAGARDVLKSIRHSFPDYLDALNNLGLAELALGNEEAAISWFQKVILCDREHSEALSNYGVVLLRHGMYDAAIRAFETAVEGARSDGRGLSFAWGGLAVARGAIGMLEGAQEAAREAERTADPLNRARFSMLMMSIQARCVTEELRRGLAASGRPPSDVAQAPAKRAMGAEPYSIFPRVSPPDARDPRPVIDGAVTRLRSLAKDIQSSSSSTALGAVLRLRHDFSWEESGNRNHGAEAAERLVEALEKDDSDAPAWVQLSLLQMGTGEYASARDFAVQAVSRNCNMESGWNSLGVAFQLNDEVPEARKAYEKALNIIRRSYDKRNKGISEAKQQGSEDGLPENEDESGKEIPFPEGESSDDENTKKQERPVEDDDLNEAGLNALAALYNNIANMRRQEGRSFSEALSYYERSLKLGGENAVVYNNLALLYISANRFSDALAMLDHALKLDPHFECALSNRLKLKALLRRKERDLEKDEDDSDNVDAEAALFS